MSHVTCEPWADHDNLSIELKEGVDVDVLDEAIAIASDMLFELTGRRFPGVCSDVVRPQARWREMTGWAPGGRYGFCGCQRGRETGCSSIPELRLPTPNVHGDSVIVTLDGTEHDASSGLFRLDDGRWLVRVDGDGWPCCQDLLLDVTEEGTWQVAYDYGRLPDAGGVRAAASLGYELYLAYTRDDKCKLPRRITSIVRQGTAIAVLDPLTLFKDGLTGLTEVDLWLVSKTLGSRRRRATVRVPGQPRSVRRTGTAWS